MTKGSDDKIVMDGEIKSLVWWWEYEVELTWNWMTVRVYPSWKIKKNNIRMIEGDKVQVELDSTDPTRGRIIYRYK